MAKSDIGRFDAIGPIHYGGWWPEPDLLNPYYPYQPYYLYGRSHTGTVMYPASCTGNDTWKIDQLSIKSVEYYPNGNIKRVEYK